MERKNSIVYLYGFSLAKSDKAKSLIKILDEQIGQEIKIELVLVHDGVIRSTKKGVNPKILDKLLKLPISVYAMIPDIKARGLDPTDIIDQIKGIDYEDLVDILVNTQKIVSWV